MAPRGVDLVPRSTDSVFFKYRSDGRGTRMGMVPSLEVNSDAITPSFYSFNKHHEVLDPILLRDYTLSMHYARIMSMTVTPPKIPKLILNLKLNTDLPLLRYTTAPSFPTSISTRQPIPNQANDSLS